MKTSSDPADVSPAPFRARATPERRDSTPDGVRGRRGLCPGLHFAPDPGSISAENRMPARKRGRIFGGYKRGRIFGGYAATSL
jgi:hypothetical protein